MTQPQGALLVGSINQTDAEAAMSTAAELLGSHLKRLPDGEIGERFHWIAFQADRLAATPGIERIGSEPIYRTHLDTRLDVRPLTIADDVDPAGLELPSLGYAEAAFESWTVFKQLLGERRIAPGTRFQVTLPTPAAVVARFFPDAQRQAFEPVYRDALYAELDLILGAIPHESLAIQWDTAVEFAFIEVDRYAHIPELAFRHWFEDVWEGVVDRAVEQAGRVPTDVEVGFHLCYGSAGGKHYVEPVDTRHLVRFSNELLKRSGRMINWIHLPVPIERDDEAYFAPLSALLVPDGTELYLGLVHHEDGVEGTTRRIATALKFTERFGVSTECGWGRAPLAHTEALLTAHRTVASPW